MNRAFSKILILIILIVLAVGGYFAWQYFGAPEEKVKDETADWETYRNSEYGFTFKYPEKEEILVEHNVQQPIVSEKARHSSRWHFLFYSQWMRISPIGF